MARSRPPGATRPATCRQGGRADQGMPWPDDRIDDEEPRRRGAVYGTSRSFRAAEHRQRVTGRTRAITLGVAASATGASAVLGAAFAGAVPGHAKPASTQASTPAQPRGAGSSQIPRTSSSPASGTGSSPAPGGGTSQAPG